MGESVKTIDLAKRMIALSGLSIQDDDHPTGDIQIKMTGLRPGEKLFEELLIGDNPNPSQHPKIMQALESFLTWDQLEPHFSHLHTYLQKNDVYKIKNLLSILVNGYNSEASVVDWLTTEQS